MRTLYNINALFGEAYNTAIENIISHVNKLGWNYDYRNNWNDAHQLAEDLKIRFDHNGEIAY
jgi:hypothetical protein